MGRLDLPDKNRDEDATERRKRSRRRFFLGGRRKHDNRATICRECGSGLLDGEHIADYECSQRTSS